MEKLTEKEFHNNCCILAAMIDYVLDSEICLLPGKLDDDPSLIRKLKFGAIEGCFFRQYEEAINNGMKESDLIKLENISHEKKIEFIRRLSHGRQQQKKHSS